jgi:hypothetical protein
MPGEIFQNETGTSQQDSGIPSAVPVVTTNASTVKNIRRRAPYGETSNEAEISQDIDVDTWTVYSTSVSTSSPGSADIIIPTVVWVLNRDIKLRGLFSIAIDNIPIERLKRNMRRLLLLYTRDLQKFARTFIELRVVRALGKWATDIASDMLREAQANFTREAVNFGEIEGLLTGSSEYIHSESDIFEKRVERITTEGGHSTKIDQYPVTTILVNFLVLGQPFFDFKERFEKFLPPSVRDQKL